MESTTNQISGQQRSRDRVAQDADSPNDAREAWHDAASALTTLYERTAVELEERVRERPYAALAAAAGIGFVLGGGLRSATGRLLLRTTARFVVPEVLASLRGVDAR